jgi:hypothetical protein
MGRLSVKRALEGLLCHAVSSSWLGCEAFAEHFLVQSKNNFKKNSKIMHVKKHVKACQKQ